MMGAAAGAVPLPTGLCDSTFGAALGAEAVCFVPAQNGLCHGDKLGIASRQRRHIRPKFAESLRCRNVGVALFRRVVEGPQRVRDFIWIPSRYVLREPRRVLIQPEKNWFLVRITEQFVAGAQPNWLACIELQKGFAPPDRKHACFGLCKQVGQCGGVSAQMRCAIQTRPAKGN